MMSEDQSPTATAPEPTSTTNNNTAAESTTTATTATTTNNNDEEQKDKWGRIVYKHGYLNRRTDILKKWKITYVAVREDKFCWFDSKDDFLNGKKKKGGMVYHGGSFVDKEDELEIDKKYVFSFNSRSRACFVETGSEEERVAWIAAVKKAIKAFNDNPNSKKSKYSHLS